MRTVRDVKSFMCTKSNLNRTDIQDRGCQVNIQHEIVSTGAQTRQSKHKEVQTEVEDDKDTRMRDGDQQRVKRLFEKRFDIMEDAIIENNNTTAFTS